ncbi:MAG: hypothetical protein ACE5D3_00100 [Candidatus Binatia bacterium]
MEVLFAQTYLLLFGKLAFGGLLALAVPDFATMERGYYKSSAAIYVGLAAVMALGELYLFVRFGDHSVVPRIALTSWLIFLFLAAAYLIALFVERPRARARAFPAALASGLLALCVTASSYVPQGLSSFASIAYAACFLAGSAVAGAALSGMLLGHWYLIDRGMDLDPLRRLLKYCRWSLQAGIITVVTSAAALYLIPESPWQGRLHSTLSGLPSWLLGGRVFAWSLALLLMRLIRRTLDIPQTMAATGLFYMASLVIAVGEILGQWLLFRTGLPL